MLVLAHASSTVPVKEDSEDIAVKRTVSSYSSSNSNVVSYATVLALLVGMSIPSMNYFHWTPTATAAVIRPLYLSEDPTKSGAVFQDCSVCPQMVVIPSGSFVMGSPKTDKDARDNEHPQLKVTITKPFAVSRFEVTFADWNACVDAGGCKHRPDDEGWGQGARPVINVSWNDITQQYLVWLTKMTGQTYRLLTEAEWEYAARAGKTTRYSWGDEPGRNNANCYNCNSYWDNEKTAPVGSFKPNDFGLYDMHGNVFEWVQDCYNDKAYAMAPADGSAAPDELNCDRVLRGGSWQSNLRAMRAAFRNAIFPDYRFCGYGFRVARDLEIPE